MGENLTIKGTTHVQRDILAVLIVNSPTESSSQLIIGVHATYCHGIHRLNKHEMYIMV